MMIEATFTKDNKKCRFLVRGHANYKERELTDRFDIVCAMVSVLAQTAIIGCIEHCKGVEIKRENGLVEIVFSQENARAKIITDSCFKGIEQVKNNFPQCFK